MVVPRFWLTQAWRAWAVVCCEHFLAAVPTRNPNRTARMPSTRAAVPMPLAGALVGAPAG